MMMLTWSRRIDDATPPPCDEGEAGSRRKPTKTTTKKYKSTEVNVYTSFGTSSTIRFTMGKHSAPTSGILFPVEVRDDGRPGKRRSTPTAKKVIGAFLRAGASAGGEEKAVALEKESSRKWRYGYIKHMLNVTRVLAAAPTFAEAAVASEAGLDAAYDAFRFQRRGGAETSLREAMAQPQRR